MTTDTITTRVDAGVDWLAVYHPDWRDRIDADDLDMASGRHCILGQLYDSGNLFGFDCGYVAALREHAGHDAAVHSRSAPAWAVERGFVVESGDGEDFVALTREWRDRLVTA